MARRHRRRGRHSFKIPVISTAILLGQVLLAHQRGGGSIEGTAAELAVLYTGYDLRNQGWNFQRLAEGYGPWLAKGLIMKVARPLGAAPRMPIRGLPISFS